MVLSEDENLKLIRQIEDYLKGKRLALWPLVGFLVGKTSWFVTFIDSEIVSWR
jgi:hypothetical protein